MKVLIAEDDPSCAQLLDFVIHQAGYDVILTSDGDSALKILQAEDAPKLAILDWMMPGMSGVDVCRKLRQTNRKVPLYIIILTAKNNEEDIITALEAGADAYITKPFNKKELVAQLREAEHVVSQPTWLHNVQAPHVLRK